MNIGEKIRMLRRSLMLTQEDLAKAIGTKKQTIHKYETGIVTNIPASKIKLMSDVLGTTPSYLMGWDETNISPNITEDYVTFPVLGDIAAGYDNIAIESWEGDTVDIPTSYLNGRNKNDFFVLSVKGDSMFPEYRENDKVLILKQTTMNYSGQVGAVLYNDEYATLKRIEFVSGEDWIRLVPINPTHVTKTITGSDLEHCRIIGIPYMLIRRIADK